MLSPKNLPYWEHISSEWPNILNFSIVIVGIGMFGMVNIENCQYQINQRTASKQATIIFSCTATAHTFDWSLILQSENVLTHVLCASHNLLIEFFAYHLQFRTSHRVQKQSEQNGTEEKSIHRERERKRATDENNWFSMEPLIEECFPSIASQYTITTNISSTMNIQHFNFSLIIST